MTQRATRLTMGWLILSILFFIPMLAHQSVPATLFGRYSPSYALMLGMMLGFIGLAGIVVWLAQRGRLQKISIPDSPRFAAMTLILGISLLAGIWLFLQPSSQFLIPAVALFRLYVAGFILVGMIAVLVRQTWQPPIGWLLPVLMVAVIGFSRRLCRACAATDVL